MTVPSSRSGSEPDVQGNASSSRRTPGTGWPTLDVLTERNQVDASSRVQLGVDDGELRQGDNDPPACVTTTTRQPFQHETRSLG